MSRTQQYEDATRRNGVDAVQLAMRTLREHWDTVTIGVNRVDGEGNTHSYELEYEPDDDELETV